MGSAGGRYRSTSAGAQQQTRVYIRGTSSPCPAPVPILRFKVRSTDAWRVWGRSPQRGPEAEPLVRGEGGRSPPEAESLLAFQRPITAKKITSFTVSSKLRVCDVSSTFNRIPNISLLQARATKPSSTDFKSPSTSVPVGTLK